MIKDEVTFGRQHASRIQSEPDWRDRRRRVHGGQARGAPRRGTILGLSMARVVALGSFWQEPFAAALAASGEGGAPTFRAHSRTKPMLSFPSTF